MADLSFLIFEIQCLQCSLYFLIVDLKPDFSPYQNKYLNVALSIGLWLVLGFCENFQVSEIIF